MSDTPETDAVIKNVGDGPYIAYLVHFARKLERERDEARMERDEVMRLTERQWLLNVACRLVSAGCKSESILDSLDEVIRERDDARRERDEALQRLSVWHGAVSQMKQQLSFAPPFHQGTPSQEESK